NAEIAAVAVHADIVGKPFGVATEVELVVGLVEIAKTSDQFGFAVALESGARNDVEDAVGAVAKLGAVTSAIDFKVVDVFGVELWPKVGSDISVGHGHAVNKPARLMSAADVELVVGKVCAGHVIGDHGEAIAARGTRGTLNFTTINQADGSC